MTQDEEIGAALQALRGAFMPVGDIVAEVDRIARSRQRRRRAGGIGLAAVVAVIGFTVIGPGLLSRDGGQSATTPPASSTVAGDMDEAQWDAAVNGYEHQLMTAAEAHDNYTGLALYYSSRQIRIYGTGQPAPDVTALIDNAPSIVTPVWVPVPYSKTELDDAATKVVAITPGVAYSQPSSDFTSVVIGVRGLDDAERVSLERESAEVTPVPIEFVKGDIDPMPGVVDCSTTSDC